MSLQEQEPSLSQPLRQAEFLRQPWKRPCLAYVATKEIADLNARPCGSPYNILRVQDRIVSNHRMVGLETTMKEAKAVKEAALDARVHHAVGPFGPVEWWIEAWQVLGRNQTCRLVDLSRVKAKCEVSGEEQISEFGDEGLQCHSPAALLQAQERFHEMKDEMSKLANETQDHGIYRPVLCKVQGN